MPWPMVGRSATTGQAANTFFPFDHIAEDDPTLLAASSHK